MSETTSTRAVNLPEELVGRIEARADATGFDSTAAYITYIVEEVLYTVDSVDEPTETDEREEIKARLESLGYLN